MHILGPCDGPTCFFGKRARGTPKKARVILFAKPLKSLEKEGKCTKTARKNTENKKQGKKSKDWRVRVFHKVYAHCALLFLQSVCRQGQSTPDPDTFEKYRDTPPISIAIFLQKYALLSVESSIYTPNLYHDTPPICIGILLQNALGSGVVGAFPNLTKGSKRSNLKFPQPPLTSV